MGLFCQSPSVLKGYLFQPQVIYSIQVKEIFFFFALLGQSNPLSRTVSCLTIIQLSQRTVWFARTLMRDQAMEKYDHSEPLTTSKLQCFLSTKGLMQVFFTTAPKPNKVPTLNPDKIHTAACDIMQHAHVGCNLLANQQGTIAIAIIKDIFP